MKWPRRDVDLKAHPQQGGVLVHRTPREMIRELAVFSCRGCHKLRVPVSLAHLEKRLHVILFLANYYPCRHRQSADETIVRQRFWSEGRGWASS